MNVDTKARTYLDKIRQRAHHACGEMCTVKRLGVVREGVVDSIDTKNNTCVVFFVDDHTADEVLLLGMQKFMGHTNQFVFYLDNCLQSDVECLQSMYDLGSPSRPTSSDLSNSPGRSNEPAAREAAARFPVAARVTAAAAHWPEALLVRRQHCSQQFRSRSSWRRRSSARSKGRRRLLRSMMMTRMGVLKVMKKKKKEKEQEEAEPRRRRGLG